MDPVEVMEMTLHNLSAEGRTSTVAIFWIAPTFWAPWQARVVTTSPASIASRPHWALIRPNGWLRHGRAHLARYFDEQYYRRSGGIWKTGSPVPGKRAPLRLPHAGWPPARYPSTNLELVHPLIHMLEYLRDKGVN